jgi:2,3-bisphosphoglycerate-independent phosphoglycerate mutase
MDIVDYDRLTYEHHDYKKFEENLGRKLKKANELLPKYDFVFIHIKETDEGGEDGEYETKLKLIESIDRQLSTIMREDIYLVVTADHSTPCCVKQHTGDPVPITITGPQIRRDNVKKFDEISCASGALNRIKGLNVMSILLNYMNRLKKFGA